jgi:hypothetical protein
MELLIRGAIVARKRYCKRAGKAVWRKAKTAANKAWSKWKSRRNMRLYRYPNARWLGIPD